MSDVGKPVTAALIIIGNEILSGRTQDANLAWLAQTLGEAGIRMMEARIVADIESEIVDAVNACRAKHAYVFTTGGIGPTHDDITAACVAKALERRFERNQEAERRLLAYYPPERVNEERMAMADMPEGAELIDNPVSVAPGFRVDNVYVLPGVPKIMQAMVQELLPAFKGGPKMQSRTVTVFAPEGDVSRGLGRIQARFADLEVGSYPFWRPGGHGTSIVIRGHDQDRVDLAAGGVYALADELHAETQEDYKPGTNSP